VALVADVIDTVIGCCGHG